MREKIAIIGSGISGISAAYLLSSKYDVYLFEKNNRLGGHTRTIYVEESTKTIPVDTGFIVFNENNYPDLNPIVDLNPNNSSLQDPYDNTLAVFLQIIMEKVYPIPMH